MKTYLLPQEVIVQNMLQRQTYEEHTDVSRITLLNEQLIRLQATILKIDMSSFNLLFSFAAQRWIRTSEIEPTLRAKLAFTSGTCISHRLVKLMKECVA